MKSCLHIFRLAVHTGCIINIGYSDVSLYGSFTAGLVGCQAVVLNDAEVFGVLRSKACRIPGEAILPQVKIDYRNFTACAGSAMLYSTIIPVLVYCL